jgi:MFS family permease
MEQYQDYFQLGELGASTGLVMMLYPAGNMVGALLMAPVSDLFGRRKAMAAGSVLIAAGAIILTAAKNPSYLLGMGVGTGTSAAPTYATEIAPPSIRGRVVGFYNTCES